MIDVENLVKSFCKTKALDGLSFTARNSSVCGILGPNGAGKSTALKSILGIVKFDSGKVLFDGEALSEKHFDIIGYLPEERGLYKRSRTIDILTYFASLKNITQKEFKSALEYWESKFGISELLNKKAFELSKGNQQKIQIIGALIHNPDYIFLDEPLSGLDPIMQNSFNTILDELKSAGKTIIISTHLLDFAEYICDEIILINKGKNVLSGTMEEIHSNYAENFFRIEVKPGSIFPECDDYYLIDAMKNVYSVIIKNDDVSGVLNRLSSKVPIMQFAKVKVSLNTIFQLNIKNNEENT